MKMHYTRYSINRLLQRKLQVDDVESIANVGLVVHREGKRLVKRGEVKGEPVHVVIEKPNVVITVYQADEWDAEVAVKHVRRPKAYA